MGKTKEGVLGAMSGLVGPVVGIVNKNNKNWFRKRPVKSKFPRSDAQLAQSHKMHLLNPLFKGLAPFLQLSFKQVSTTRDLSPYNAAKSANLLTGIKGEYPNQEINWEGIVIASGTRAQPEKVKVRSVEEGFELTWDADFDINNGSGYDRTMIYIYSTELPLPKFVTDGARRSELKDLFELPKGLRDKKFEIFLAFKDAKSDEVSKSVYCGSHVFVS